MKRSIILGIIVTLLLPIFVSASKVDLRNYNYKNLADTLSSENISADLSNYQENDNQVPIYMFRGQGCSHCQDFLEFVANTLVKEYGNSFKLISFETWNDSNNQTLLKTVSKFLGEDASGVPYIIIGNKTFLGYAASSNNEIISAITSLYNEKEKYDVFEEINKEDEKVEKAAKPNTKPIIIGNIVITTIGVIITILYVNSAKNEILKSVNKKMSKK